MCQDFFLTDFPLHLQPQEEQGALAMFLPFHLVKLSNVPLTLRANTSSDLELCPDLAAVYVIPAEFLVGRPPPTIYIFRTPTPKLIKLRYSQILIIAGNS